MLCADPGRLQSARTDPAAHRFGVAFGPASSLGYGEHCRHILQQLVRGRTATPAINRGKRRHSAARGEYESPFLNGMQRSVNRKVRGSNPRSGAKSEYEICGAVNYSLTAVQQPYSNGARNRCQIGAHRRGDLISDPGIASGLGRLRAVTNRKALYSPPAL